jgi:hypothetical protein
MDIRRSAGQSPLDRRARPPIRPIFSSASRALFADPIQIRNLQGLFDALDRIVGEVAALAAETQAGISRHSFSPYYSYRAAIDQYEALHVTIDSKIKRLPGNSRAPHAAKLLEFERRLLGLTIKSAFTYFFALSAIPILPIGIKELFTRELKELRDARERLHAPEHAGQLPPELEGDLDTAEEILIEVMEKAPSLLNFDGPADRARNAAAGEA